jgi:DNA-binding transcriptional MerR regulator
MQAAMKVGALAKRTGLTVRTLHHYDEIGLLSPSHRPRSGHRVYGEHELSRLQQMASLKHLGLPLEEIRACLRRPEYSLERVLDLQIERIEEQIRRHERLRGLIEALRDQIAELDRRRAEVGKDRIHQIQQEWSRLFAEYGRAMEAGLSPDHESVRELAV